jgi:hypothetical protein
MKSDEIIDSLIRQSQEGLEIQPGISSFDRTMQKLEQEKKKKRRFVAFYLFAGLLVVSGILALLNTHSSKKENNTAPATSEFKNLPEVKANASNTSGPDISTSTIISSAPPPITQQNITPTSHSTASHHSSPVVSGKANNPIPAVSSSSSPSHSILVIEPTTPLASSEAHQSPAKEEELPFLTPDPKTEPASPVKQEVLPVSNIIYDSVKTISALASIPASVPVSPEKEKLRKAIQYVAAICFTPQVTSFALNSKSSSDPNQNAFADNYIAARNNSKANVINFGAGIKGGLIYNYQWEFLLEAGYLEYSYQERPIEISGNTTSVTYVNPGGGGVNPNFTIVQVVSNTASSPLYQNTFKYMSLSLESNRLIPTRYVQLKAGLALQSNYLVDATTVFVQSPYEYGYAQNYHGAPLNRWVFVPELNLGVAKDFGTHFQVQLCSKTFYGISSIFDHSYFLGQHSYGIGLEGSLLYKF